MSSSSGRIDPRQCDGNGSERDQYRGDHERQRWPHAASVEQELSNGLSGVERNHIAGQHGTACLRLRTFVQPAFQADETTTDTYPDNEKQEKRSGGNEEVR